MAIYDETEPEDALAPLVDVTKLSMDSLLNVKNEALNRCLRRILHDIDDPNGVISAFANVP